MCQLVWSLTYFNALKYEHFKVLCDNISMTNLTDLTVIDIRKLIQTEMMVQQELESSDVTLPEPLRSRVYQAWRERIYYSNRTSYFHKVSDFLFK